MSNTNTRILQRYHAGEVTFDLSMCKNGSPAYVQACPVCGSCDGTYIDSSPGMECTTLIKCDCGKWYIIIS